MGQGNEWGAIELKGRPGTMSEKLDLVRRYSDHSGQNNPLTLCLSNVGLGKGYRIFCLKEE